MARPSRHGVAQGLASHFIKALVWGVALRRALETQRRTLGTLGTYQMWPETGLRGPEWEGQESGPGTLGKGAQLQGSGFDVGGDSSTHRSCHPQECTLGLSCPRRRAATTSQFRLVWALSRQGDPCPGTSLAHLG